MGISVPLRRKFSTGVSFQPPMKQLGRNLTFYRILCFIVATVVLAGDNTAIAIRFPDRISRVVPAEDATSADQVLKPAVFALGSFWRSESVFGCLDGVVRTTVGYAGGSKPNPEYRSLGDHAESVQIEYDPRLINFRQLLEVFWSNHDCRQVFGQGPDVGLLSLRMELKSPDWLLSAKKESRSRNSIVTTQIQQLGAFYPAEPEHQEFELKRNPFLLQLVGNLPEEELEKSSLAAKLNGNAAELCPLRIQNRIDGKISDIIKKGWPILREV